jgi:DNA-binding response OmpR family regulator
MSHAPVTILLIEDISTVQFFVRNALSALPRPYNLITAPTIAEARAAIGGKFIDLFIVDNGLPDGNGIDFLCEIAALQPQASALIVTATPSDELRARADQLGVVQILSKPIQRDRLCAAVSKLLGWNGESASEDASFRATLSGLTPLDIVQLKCMSGSTSILEFTNEKRSGRVYFEKGNVAHALLFLDDGSKVSGPEAFSEIAGWESGRVAEVQDGTPYPRTIRENWQSLLLEVAQAHDERSVTAA